MPKVSLIERIPNFRLLTKKIDEIALHQLSEIEVDGIPMRAQKLAEWSSAVRTGRELAGDAGGVAGSSLNGWGQADATASTTPTAGAFLAGLSGAHSGNRGDVRDPRGEDRRVQAGRGGLGWPPCCLQMQMPTPAMMTACFASCTSELRRGQIDYQGAPCKLSVPRPEALPSASVGVVTLHPRMGAVQ